MDIGRVGQPQRPSWPWVRHAASTRSAPPAAVQVWARSPPLGAYLALVQLVLMSRSPWLDQVLGIDRLAAACWVGFACLWLLLGHGVMIAISCSLGDGIPGRRGPRS